MTYNEKSAQMLYQRIRKLSDETFEKSLELSREFLSDIDDDERRLIQMEIRRMSEDFVTLGDERLVALKMMAIDIEFSVFSRHESLNDE